MTLKTPSPATLQGPSLLDILRGFYDAIVELRKGTDRATSVVTFAATADTKVFHGLGRPVVSWSVIDKNANADVWQSTTENANAKLYIVMQASAAVTAKLRFE